MSNVMDLCGRSLGVGAATLGTVLSLSLLDSPSAQAALIWDYSPATTGANTSLWNNVSWSQNFADQFQLTQDTNLTGIDIYTDSDFASIGKS